MAFRKREKDEFHLSGDAFFWCTMAIYAGISLMILLLAVTFINSVWAVGDTTIFYKMADVIVSGGTPYVDFADPKPPLIFFTLAVPSLLGEKLFGGALLVVLSNLISAALVMTMAWRLYGRLPGLVAGILFMAGIALSEGYFILIEPFALLFILLATYIVLFTNFNKKYLLAGVCAGIAIGYKQYALLLIPLLLFYMYRRNELKGAAQFIAGALAPLLLIFGAIFLLYGAQAGAASLQWSFGIADEYVTEGQLGGISTYMASDPLIAAANLLLEASLFATLIVLAAVEFLWDRPVSRREEYFFLAGLAFLATLAIRQYLHYWALALPFIVLLCVRRYRDHEKP